MHIMNIIKKRIKYAKKEINDLLSVINRRSWPKVEPANNAVSIVIVNYNTADLLAGLIFSLFRILGKDQFLKIVIVDNGSTDESVGLILALREKGLVDAILNSKQKYHGLGLNQGMNYLRNLAMKQETACRYVLILDSDVVVLHRNTISDAVRFAESTNASLVGQFQYEGWPEGYAHVSALLLDPTKVWRRGVHPFDDSGTPAAKMHYSLRKKESGIKNFPFRDANYVLHIGRGTITKIHNSNSTKNRHYRSDPARVAPHFHGNPHGQEIYNTFEDLFRLHVHSILPKDLLDACMQPSLLKLDSPYLQITLPKNNHD